MSHPHRILLTRRDAFRLALTLAVILGAVAAGLWVYRLGWDRGEIHGAAAALGPSVAYIREHCPPAASIGTPEAPVEHDL